MVAIVCGDISFWFCFVISLMISSAQHLFMYPTVHLHALFWKMSTQVFCLFFNQIVYFFDIELWELCIYTFILTSYWSYHLQILSHSVEFLFILSVVSFAVQKLLSLIRSRLFVFNSFALGDTADKGLLWFTLKSVLSMFSSRSFTVSGI